MFLNDLVIVMNKFEEFIESSVLYGKFCEY